MAVVLAVACDSTTEARLRSTLDDADLLTAPTLDRHTEPDPALVVVGPGSPRPLVEARRAYDRFGAVHVLLLPSEDEYEAVQGELLFAPSIHRSIRCLPATALRDRPLDVRPIYEAAAAASFHAARRHAAHDALRLRASQLV